jgi:hypothetical protein
VVDDAAARGAARELSIDMTPAARTRKALPNPDGRRRDTLLASGRMWFRLLAAAMGLVFVGFTSVQFDDPDWPLWVGVYGLAALVSFAATAGRAWTWTCAALCVATLAWSATLLPRLRDVKMAEVFGSFSMKTAAIEEAREGLGLLIVAVWAAVLWIG